MKLWAYLKTTYRTMSDFRADWARLTDADKADFKRGFDNGTLTY